MIIMERTPRAERKQLNHSPDHSMDMTTPAVLVAGEALVDLFPTSGGRLADAESFRRRAGGAPANVAVGLARLETEPLLWTRVGTDPFGTHLQAVLDREGVPEDLVVVDEERKTAHTLVGDDPTADQSFTFFESGTATMAMEAGTVSEATLDAVEWVHLGGVLLCREQGRAAMLDLAERAQAAGCTVSFDPNTRLDLWPDRETLAATMERALTLTDVLKTDREDLSILLDTETDIDTVARALQTYGPHTVCLTRGSEGTYACSTPDAPWGETVVEAPAPDVSVVETTGAGDAFVAGLVTALQTNGLDLPGGVRFANAVGALATTDTGAMAALPTRAAVTDLRSEQR